MTRRSSARRVTTRWPVAGISACALLAGALPMLDRVQDLASEIEDVIEWGRSGDAIFGSAGTSLFLLYAAREERSVEVEVTHLAGPVYLFRVPAPDGSHVNQVVSAGPDGILMVDMSGEWRSMTPRLAQVRAVKDSLRRFHDQVRYLINTHWHGDHSGSNGEFSGDGTDIVAHANARRRMASPQRPPWSETAIGPLDSLGLPTVTFEDSLIIPFNGEAVSLYHFGRAHTDGDAVVYFPGSRVVHLGDLYHGIDGLSGGGDMDGLAGTLTQVLDRIDPETRVVTGHGGVGSVGELRRYAQLLADALAHVRREVAGGKGREAILAAGLPPALADRTAASAESVVRWLGQIHDTAIGNARSDT